MKLYYDCMSSACKYTMVELANVCMGKPQVKELNALRAEEVKLFELTECPVASDVQDVFLFGNWLHALHTDGTLVDQNGKPVPDLPPIERAESPFLTEGAWLRGRDGKLYDSNRKAQTEGSRQKRMHPREREISSGRTDQGRPHFNDVRSRDLRKSKTYRSCFCS